MSLVPVAKLESVITLTRPAPKFNAAAIVTLIASELSILHFAVPSSSVFKITSASSGISTKPPQELNSIVSTP